HVEKDKGDCIDCKLCIHVCPTGIDIRNGTQLECVNCTACIDACDEVMDKINKPKGLIRFSSFTAIDSGIKKIFTPRVIAYSVVLGALLVLLTYFLVTRSDIDATIHRVPGMSSLKTDDGKVGNLFNMQFLNKTFDAISLNVKMEEFPEASIEQVGNAKIDLPPGDNHNGVFMVKIPPEKLAPGKNPIVIGVYSGNDLLYELETNFMGPMPGKR
ncbi:MAG: 4Fe-4S binding protein, partial [Cyclobacteriaceae bacterium]|nr:4Fe-4S binding protein [Cyclobacteriaceae bacterium]